MPLLHPCQDLGVDLTGVVGNIPVVVQVVNDLVVCVEGEEVDIIVLQEKLNDMALRKELAFQLPQLLPVVHTVDAVGGKVEVKLDVGVLIGKIGDVLGNIGIDPVVILLGDGEHFLGGYNGVPLVVGIHYLLAEGKVIAPVAVVVKGHLDPACAVEPDHILQGGKQDIDIKQVVHVIEQVIVIEVGGVVRIIHVILVVKETIAVQASNHHTQARLALCGDDQVIIDLLVAPAGVGHLHGMCAKEGIQLRGLEAFCHRASGDNGIIVEVLDDTIVLVPGVVQGIGKHGKGLMVVEIGIHYDHKGTGKQQYDQETA